MSIPNTGIFPDPEDSKEVDFKITTSRKAEAIGMKEEYMDAKAAKKEAIEDYKDKNTEYLQSKVNIDCARENVDSINGFIHPIKKLRAHRRLRLAKENKRIAKRKKNLAKEKKKSLIQKFQEIVWKIKSKYNRYRQNRRFRKMWNFKRMINPDPFNVNKRKPFSEYLKNKAKEGNTPETDVPDWDMPTNEPNNKSHSDGNAER